MSFLGSQPIRMLFFLHTSKSACHKVKKTKKKSFHELKNCAENLLAEIFSERLLWWSVRDPCRPHLHLPLADAHFRSCHLVRPVRLSSIIPTLSPSISVCVAWVQVCVCVRVCLRKATGVNRRQFQWCSNAGWHFI